MQYGTNFLKYFAVGIISNIVDICMYTLIIMIWADQYIIANIVSKSVTFVFSFGLNNFWTFEKDEINLKRLLRYESIHLFNIITLSLLLRIAIVCFSMEQVNAKVFINGLSCIWNYLFAKKFIYK